MIYRIVYVSEITAKLYLHLTSEVHIQKQKQKGRVGSLKSLSHPYENISSWEAEPTTGKNARNRRCVTFYLS